MDANSVFFISVAILLSVVALCITWYKISELKADAAVATAAVAAGLEQHDVGDGPYRDVIWVKPRPVETQK